MARDSEPAPRFAPDDLTDGRKAGEWETRYVDEARKRIRTEAIYLAVHLLAVPIACALLAYMAPAANAAMSAGGDAVPCAQQLAFAWVGGILGGTLFSIKWLYHSVAKNTWNIDRRLWRLFTPHVSGALAFVFVVLSASGLLVIFDKEAFQSFWVCFGLGFLVGYFSDSAMAKLSELAQTLFGSSNRPLQPKDAEGNRAEG